MLKLFVCKNCSLIFPASENITAGCPKCGETAIETEYFLVDLMDDNARITREIYKKYNIEYEEFSDLVNRVSIKIDKK